MPDIGDFTRQEDGSYTNDRGQYFANLKDLFEHTVAQWKLSRAYIAVRQERYDAAKAGAKEQSAAYMLEMFPELETFTGMEKIEKQHDAVLRQIVLAQHVENPEEKFPGTNTMKRKDVEIDMAAAIKYAWHVRPEWLTLTPEALKQIKGAFTDRMHPLAGMLPDEIATFKENISPVIKDTELLNGGKKTREEIGE